MDEANAGEHVLMTSHDTSPIIGGGRCDRKMNKIAQKTMKMLSHKRKRVVGNITWSRKHLNKDGSLVSDVKLVTFVISDAPLSQPGMVLARASHAHNERSCSCYWVCPPSVIGAKFTSHSPVWCVDTTDCTGTRHTLDRGAQLVIDVDACHREEKRCAANIAYV